MTRSRSVGVELRRAREGLRGATRSASASRSARSRRLPRTATRRLGQRPLDRQIEQLPRRLDRRSDRDERAAAADPVAELFPAGLADAVRPRPFLVVALRVQAVHDRLAAHAVGQHDGVVERRRDRRESLSPTTCRWLKPYCSNTHFIQPPGMLSAAAIQPDARLRLQTIDVDRRAAASSRAPSRPLRGDLARECARRQR